MIDDYLKTCNHCLSTSHSASGKPPKLTDAEILFVFIIACLDHGANTQQAQRAMKRARNITHKLSRSQFNRRIHALHDRLLELLALLNAWAKTENTRFAVDFCPLPVCKNVRIRRSRLVQGEAFRGYNASKREYFYGYKVHLITALDGRIVEFDFSPGSSHDQIGFELLGFDLTPISVVYADKAYNNYEQEVLLAEAAEVDFQPIRRSNSRHADNDYCTNWLRKQARRHVETDISEPVGLLISRANQGDSKAAEPLLSQLAATTAHRPPLLVDAVYPHTFVSWAAQALGWPVDVLLKPEAGHFVVVARRWVVERSFGWLVGLVG